MLLAQTTHVPPPQPLSQHLIAQIVLLALVHQNLRLLRHEETIIAANNYAASLRDLHLFEEARSLLRKTIPTAQRVLGEDNYLTLLLKKKFAQSLYRDDGATLDDLREAVTTLEETERIARRVLSGAHPLTTTLEDDLQDARAKVRATRDALRTNL